VRRGVEPSRPGPDRRKSTTKHFSGKMDTMLDKQDSTLGEIQGLRLDMKSYMNQRFERIETDLAELKAAMRGRGII